MSMNNEYSGASGADDTDELPRRSWPNDGSAPGTIPQADQPDHHGWPPPTGDPAFDPTPRPVQRRYGAVLPALGASITSGLFLVVSGLIIRDQRPTPESSFGRDAVGHLVYYDFVQMQSGPTADRPSVFWLYFSALVIMATVAALVFGALAGQRAQASRRLVFLSTWFAVVVGAALTTILPVVDSDQSFGRLFPSVLNIACGYGVRFGWIPAIVAAALRIGRPVRR